MDHPILKKLEQITTIILDVDGVLTDGSLLVTEEGQLLRSMNIKDGYALKKAVDSGLQIIIISGGSSEGVRLRLQGLGITEIHLKVQDKPALFKDLQSKLNFSAANSVYMGDDMPDLEVMQLCGLKACPSDAIWEVQEVSEIICNTSGGKGCVRELIEMVLKAQAKW